MYHITYNGYPMPGSYPIPLIAAILPVTQGAVDHRRRELHIPELPSNLQQRVLGYLEKGGDCP